MLVDDHQVVRDGIKLLLADTPDVVVCAEAASAREAVAIAARPSTMSAPTAPTPPCSCSPPSPTMRPCSPREPRDGRRSQKGIQVELSLQTALGTGAPGSRMRTSYDGDLIPWPGPWIVERCP